MECLICFEVNEESPIIELNCNHTFCVDCISIYLSEHKNLPQCALCTERISFSFVKKKLPHMSNILRFNSHTDCPLTNCEGVLFDQCCNVCKIKICIKCNQLKHKGSCKEEEILSTQYIKVEMIKCSKCKTIIEHNGGCELITCICGNEFKHVDKRGLKRIFNNLDENDYKLHLKTVASEMNKKIEERKRNEELEMIKRNAELEMIKKNAELEIIKRIKELEIIKRIEDRKIIHSKVSDRNKKKTRMLTLVKK